MCLISKWRFPRKAEKDIVCYKVLRALKYPAGPEKIQFFTPFVGDIIDIHKPIIATSNVKPIKKWWDRIISPHTKTYGYIHTYSTKRDARGCADALGFNCRIFKCIIPKGTEYHIGRGGDYCSKMIVMLYD